MKTCSKCKVEKPLNEFYDNPRHGKDTYCKVCRVAYNKSRKDLNNTRRRDRNSTEPEYREKVCKGRRDSHKRNLEVAMLGRARNRAIKLGVGFDLEIGDLVIPDICPLLEVPIVPGEKGNYFSTPSVDRVNNSKGYTKDNIRIISMLANSMKSSATEEQLLKFCKNMPAYLKVKI